MIVRVGSDHAGFHEVHFRPGFNLVLAHRTRQATERDSTNSLGKSSLVELLHYALGSEPKLGELPRVPELDTWRFEYELEVGGVPVTLSRRPSAPKEVVVRGAPAAWGGKASAGAHTFKLREWTDILGREVFGLAGEPGEPSFRQLIRYFVRYKDRDFLDPFDFLESSVWSQRCAAAWLLGLSWRIPAEAERLAADQKSIRELKKLAGRDVLVRLGGDRPKLEAERARLQSEVDRLEGDLKRFVVHAHYADIERRANELTSLIGAMSDENVADGRLVVAYKDAMTEAEVDLDPDDLRAMYEEAQVWLPERVTARLAEVRTFHDSVLANRKAFLSAEVDRIQGAIEQRRIRVSELDAERAELMKVLASHRALEHFSKLDNHLSRCRAQLAEVEQRLLTLSRFDQATALNKSNVSQLALRAQREHDERSRVRDRAQRLFSELVREMYHEEGRLLIDDSRPAYDIRPDIPSIGSTGVSQLATACVDLTLARLHAERGTGPRLLVHDSRMFHGMDPRQRGATLAMAFHESEALGYRYVGLLNESEFEACARYMPESFKPAEHVRLRLYDGAPEGGLFGFRFRGAGGERTEGVPPCVLTSR